VAELCHEQEVSFEQAGFVLCQVRQTIIGESFGVLVQSAEKTTVILREVKMWSRSRSSLSGCVAATIVWTGITMFPAQAADDFYRGRNVRVIISASAGGGYDTYARLVTNHMARFIRGEPRMVHQNMPGAGHRIAAGYLYTKAAHDGSVIGSVGQTLPRQQAIGEKGIQFDTRKFNWIGNPNEGNNLVVVWHTTGVKTIEDAKRKEVLIGGTGAGSITSTLPRVLNNVLGTKFRIIWGFRGGSAVNLAMLRGEVEGRGSLAWASLRGTKYEWYRDKKVNILVQVGLRKEKDLPDVPLLMDLARNEAERRVFRMISSDVSIGRPIVAPPDVPSDRVSLLRAAFDKTMKDSKFIAAAKKSRLDINPVSGSELQKIVEDVVSSPEEISKMMKAAMTKGELFKCTELVKDKKLCRSKKRKKKTN
jgi:tripartite-type tricarboxylate transporter receptor subunit TctC